MGRPEPHTLTVRVYYEDTDLAGIVYHANYLKFIERARTEFVRDLGIDQTHMKEREGVVFAVRRIEADYLVPAKFDDVLTVVTSVTSSTTARIVLQQDILRGETVCFSASVTLVAMTTAGRPTRLPADIRRPM